MVAGHEVLGLSVTAWAPVMMGNCNLKELQDYIKTLFKCSMLDASCLNAIFVTSPPDQKNSKLPSPLMKEDLKKKNPQANPRLSISLCLYGIVCSEAGIKQEQSRSL